MILVRDVFYLKFGKANDAKALMQEMKQLMPSESSGRSRVLFDLAGPSYTMVWELSYDSLSAWEKEMSGGMSDKRWHQWYQKFIPLVESSHREIFTIEK